MFPIFASSWVLLQVNMREKTVFALDPGHAYQTMNALLVNLFVYLRSELTFHRNEAIERSQWSELRFKTTPANPSSHSGLAISLSAYTTATGKVAPPASHFRLRMLKSISNLSNSLWSGVVRRLQSTAAARTQSFLQQSFCWTGVSGGGSFSVLLQEYVILSSDSFQLTLQRLDFALLAKYVLL